ncbi:MAG: potassium channel family protein [Actinomycetia bacterium]|nr:potassium channel family protein [Actinomycetes bacterium]
MAHGRHPADESSYAVRLPRRYVSPGRSVVTRLAIAVAILTTSVVIVWLERDGYRDSYDGAISFLDAVYYTTVTLSTTGYGDITPVSDAARLANIVLITPLRIAFLVVLVGTTIEVLADRTRRDWEERRWRSRVNQHTVIIGFGTKGRSALQGLLDDGTPPGQIVVVDASGDALDEANRLGTVTVLGDATRSTVLRDAEVPRAAQVIVSTERDDTTVLCTLTARRLNPSARIVSAVREAENAQLVLQSGANSVITSAAAAGRLLALSVLSPTAGGIMEDLLVAGEGLEVIERDITPIELGRPPADSEDLVLAVIRDGVATRFDQSGIKLFQRGDRVVVIRHAEHLRPPAAQPGPG